MSSTASSNGIVVFFDNNVDFSPFYDENTDSFNIGIGSSEDDVEAYALPSALFNT